MTAQSPRPFWQQVGRGAFAGLATVSLFTLFLPGCSDDSSAPAPQPLANAVTFLTTDNLNGDEDDPFVSLDANGTVHIAWLSDRDGTKDIYHLKSTSIDVATGTITWAQPIDHLTESGAGAEDNYPSIMIDNTGVIHLTWHRVTPQGLGAVSHIMYKRSDAQGNFGAPALNNINLTSGANYDRFSRFARYANNDLRIYFNGNNRKPLSPNKNDIFLLKSTDNGLNWDTTPTEVASLNTSLATDDQSALPTIVKLSNTSYMATFTRWKAEPSSDFLDPTADSYFSDSTDGETWTAPQRMTQDSPDDKLDLSPGFFFNHAGTPFITWVTTALGDPLLDLISIPVSQRGNYPAAATLLNPAKNVTDHSPKILPLTINGQQVFLTVWVRIASPPHNQVVYRVSSTL